MKGRLIECVTPFSALFFGYYGTSMRCVLCTVDAWYVCIMMLY